MPTRIREDDALKLERLGEDLRAARAAWNLAHTETNRQRLIHVRALYASLAAVMGVTPYTTKETK